MKIRPNRKIKYSEKDFIEKHYIKEDGKAHIPVKIDKVNDLYMKNDYLQLDLSDSVFDYIEEVAYLIPRHIDIVLEIHCPVEITEKKQKRIVRVFRNNYGSDIDDVEYDMRKNYKQAVIEFIIAMIFIIISFCIKSQVISMEFLAEFFMIAGWVFAWEMIESLGIQNAGLMSKKLNKLQLYDAGIMFICDNNDDVEDSEIYEQEELLEEQKND